MKLKSFIFLLTFLFIASLFLLKPEAVWASVPCGPVNCRDCEICTNPIEGICQDNCGVCKQCTADGSDCEAQPRGTDCGTSGDCWHCDGPDYGGNCVIIPRWSCSGCSASCSGPDYSNCSTEDSPACTQKWCECTADGACIAGCDTSCGSSCGAIPDACTVTCNPCDNSITCGACGGPPPTATPTPTTPPSPCCDGSSPPQLPIICDPVPVANPPTLSGVVGSWGSCGTCVCSYGGIVNLDGVNYPASCNVGAKTCSYTPSVPLAAGTHAWEISFRNGCENTTKDCGPFVIPTPGGPTPIPTATPTATPTPCPPVGLPGNPTSACTCAAGLGGECTCVVSWTAASGATGYNLRIDANHWSWAYVCPAPSPDICLDNLPSGTYCSGEGICSYSFTASGGRLYGWWVHSSNGCTASQQVDGADFTARYLPPYPGSFTCSPVCNQGILFQWGDNSVNETGFRVVKYSNVIGTVGPDVTSYFYNWCVDHNFHTYNVAAVNSCGTNYSPWPISCACPVCAPTPMPTPLPNCGDLCTEGLPGDCGYGFGLVCMPPDPDPNQHCWNPACPGDVTCSCLVATPTPTITPTPTVTPTPGPMVCTSATIDPSSFSIGVGGEKTIVVISLQGGARIGPKEDEDDVDHIRFASDDPSIAEVISESGENDYTYPYQAVVSGKARGGPIAIIAYVYLEDGGNYDCVGQTMVTIIPTIGWFQTDGGDIFSSGIIFSPIPETCRGSCYPYFSLNKLGNSSGAVSHGIGGLYLGLGTASVENWLAPGSTESRNKYNDYYQMLGSPATDNFNTFSDFKDGITVYYSADDVILNTRSALETRKAVVLINGKLNIGRDFSISAGGAVVFIVKGDIAVAAGVTNIQGVFMTDGNFVSEAGGTLLTVEGVVAGNSFFLGRDLGVDNETAPAEKFVFRPDFIYNSPMEIWESFYAWKELAPMKE